MATRHGRQIIPKPDKMFPKPYPTVTPRTQHAKHNAAGSAANGPRKEPKDKLARPRKDVRRKQNWYDRQLATFDEELYVEKPKIFTQSTYGACGKSVYVEIQQEATFMDCMKNAGIDMAPSLTQYHLQRWYSEIGTWCSRVVERFLRDPDGKDLFDLLIAFSPTQINAQKESQQKATSSAAAKASSTDAPASSDNRSKSSTGTVTSTTSGTDFVSPAEKLKKEMQKRNRVLEKQCDGPENSVLMRRVMTTLLKYGALFFVIKPGAEPIVLTDLSEANLNLNLQAEWAVQVFFLRMTDHASGKMYAPGGVCDTQSTDLSHIREYEYSLRKAQLQDAKRKLVLRPDPALLLQEAQSKAALEQQATNLVGRVGQGVSPLSREQGPVGMPALETTGDNDRLLSTPQTMSHNAAVCAEKGMDWIAEHPTAPLQPGVASGVLMPGTIGYAHGTDLASYDTSFGLGDPKLEKQDYSESARKIIRKRRRDILDLGKQIERDITALDGGWQFEFVNSEIEYCSATWAQRQSCLVDVAGQMGYFPETLMQEFTYGNCRNSSKESGGSSSAGTGAVSSGASFTQDAQRVTAEQNYDRIRAKLKSLLPRVIQFLELHMFPEAIPEAAFMKSVERNTKSVDRTLVEKAFGGNVNK